MEHRAARCADVPAAAAQVGTLRSGAHAQLSQPASFIAFPTAASSAGPGMLARCVEHGLRIGFASGRVERGMHRRDGADGVRFKAFQNLRGPLRVDRVFYAEDKDYDAFFRREKPERYWSPE